MEYIMEYIMENWQTLSSIAVSLVGIATLGWRLVRGMRAILRDRIIQMYNYHIKLRYIRIHDIDNLEALYEAYRALGGNGTATKLVEELRQLPSSPKVDC